MQSVPRTADLARRLDPMFSSDRPVAIRMWAVLEGTISGRIVVDRLPPPTVALVQELTEGTTYITGSPTAQQLADALELLRATSGVAICLWADNPLLSILPDAPSYVGGGIDFTDRSPAVDLERLGSVPAGYRIRSGDYPHLK